MSSLLNGVQLPRMNEAVYILDASALIALLFNEPGANRVLSALPLAKISAVNLSEVTAKLIERGVAEADIVSSFAELTLDVVPFDTPQALLAGSLRASTRHAGLSLGDRACLALAQSMGAIALTTDSAWVQLKTRAQVEMIR